MSAARTRSSIRFSILDRLTGTAEVKTVQPVREMSAEGLRRSVLKDLQRLLNTRNDLGHWLSRFTEGRRSHLAFGIPDLSAYSQSNAADRQQICTWIDGYMTVDWRDDRPAAENGRNGQYTGPGHIALQGHDPTTTLSFRNLRIAETPVR